MSIKSLAMLKMEKNFKAVIDKGYPRQPYKHYALTFLMQRFVDESKELEEAMEIYVNAESHDTVITADVREEIADVSNCLDYLYEAIQRVEEEWAKYSTSLIRFRSYIIICYHRWII
jgi:hypothetical protein